MRIIIILVLVTIALAILRMLVNDVTSAVGKAWKKNQADSPRATSSAKGGKLERDPETGAYVDPATALREKVGDRVYYFESEASRDAYISKKRGAKA